MSVLMTTGLASNLTFAGVDFLVKTSLQTRPAVESLMLGSSLSPVLTLFSGPSQAIQGYKIATCSGNLVL